jgi:hypothetical protein
MQLNQNDQSIAFSKCFDLNVNIMSEALSYLNNCIFIDATFFLFLTAMKTEAIAVRLEDLTADKKYLL